MTQEERDMFMIDIAAVQPYPTRQLELTFADGLKGTVDLDEIIQHYTGVFAPLLDENYFSQVRLNAELGTIVWPNGADLCPDVLYAYVSGKPIVVNGETVYN
jgi:hypothetical protein